jgi:hypothetical protein
MASEQVQSSVPVAPPFQPVSAPIPALAADVPSPVPAAPQLPPLQAWLARLGPSGKILAVGALVGVLAVFLPLLTMSMSMELPKNAFGGKNAVNMNLPGMSTSQSVMVASDWRGVLCLVGYLGALALTVVLYPPNGLREKVLGWAGAGVGAFVVLLSLWLLFLALNGSAGMSGFGASLKISVGLGTILNVVAAAVVTAGGALKAREEGLF